MATIRSLLVIIAFALLASGCATNLKNMCIIADEDGAHVFKLYDFSVRPLEGRVVDDTTWDLRGTLIDGLMGFQYLSLNKQHLGTVTVRVVPESAEVAGQRPVGYLQYNGKKFPVYEKPREGYLVAIYGDGK